MYLIVISSQLLWVLARCGTAPAFCLQRLYVGTGPARLGTARHSLEIFSYLRTIFGSSYHHHY